MLPPETIVKLTDREIADMARIKMQRAMILVALAGPWYYEMAANALSHFSKASACVGLSAINGEQELYAGLEWLQKTEEAFSTWQDGTSKESGYVDNLIAKYTREYFSDDLKKQYELGVADGKKQALDSVILFAGGVVKEID